MIKSLKQVLKERKIKKMAKHIHKCISCNNYTLSEKCKCGNKAIIPRPPKFSLDDKYASLKRKVRKEELKKKCLV